MNKPEITRKNPRILLWILPLGIAILTFLCYHYSLGNHFTNWDDGRFIPENVFIKSFSATNLKMMLFHDVTRDYYNPVTIMSYAVNYHFSGLTPHAYYLTNILIHILNSCLMFFLVLMLLKAMEGKGYGVFKWKEWLAFFCTLAYAIHPMHVESVSWIAERKDVLYAFFYFAGMMAYIKYVTKNEKLKAKNILFAPLNAYLLVLILFLFSLLSKPMAIVFPFSLLALDVLLKRDKTASIKKILLEKLPFITITLTSALTTYSSTISSGAVREHQVYSFLQRFLFASYSFYMYIVKAFIPLSQSSYYPYPEMTGGSGNLPFIFYLSPFIALLVIALPLYFSYRSGKDNFRIVLFGLGFYFFNIIIVTQIIGSGPTMMAERYSYICYFGIFFPVTCFVCKIIQKSRQFAINLWLAVTSVYLLFFAVLCYQRTLVWHSSETLWTDVAQKYPHRVIEAYNNLGNYYFENGKVDRAYDNYKEAIDLRTEDSHVYCNMGSLMGAKNQYKIALNYYATSLKIDSNDALTYIDRAVTYSAMGRYDLAMVDYRRSSKLNPYSESLLKNIAYTCLNAHQFDSAIYYYTQVIQINPTNSGYFHYRGVAEFDNGLIKPAMDDFMKNLNMAPHDSECMFYLSIAYTRSGDFNSAYKYAQMSQNSQYLVPDDYIRLLKTKLNIQ